MNEEEVGETKWWGRVQRTNETQSKDGGCKMFWPVKNTMEMADGPTMYV